MNIELYDYMTEGERSKTEVLLQARPLVSG